MGGFNATAYSIKHLNRGAHFIPVNYWAGFTKGLSTKCDGENDILGIRKQYRE